MTLEQIKTYIQKITAKDVSGRTLTEDDYNIFIKIVDIELFNKEYDALVKAASSLDIPLSQHIYNTTALNEFKVADSVLNISLGKISLPADYRYYTSLLGYYNTKLRDVDVVSDEEFSQLKSNLYIENPEEYIKAKISGNYLCFIPNDIAIAYLSYLKIPNEPFYDYVIQTTTNKVIYMPVSSYLSGNTLYTDNTMATTIATDVIHLDSPTLPYTSLTVEFEWRKDRHVELANMIVDKILQAQKDIEGYQINIAEKQET